MTHAHIDVGRLLALVSFFYIFLFLVD